MSLALVASCYNEVDKIKRQLEEKRISYIHVYPYGSEPEGYDVIEYNVRPDKTHGEILDMAKVISSHGFPTDIYNAPVKELMSEKNKIAMDKATRHLSMEHLLVTLNDSGITEVDRDMYVKKIEKIKANKKRLSSLTEDELKKKLDLEEEPIVIISIIAVMMDKKHNTDMQDKWGRPARGYVASNGKPVVNFVNGSSIGWIAELWTDLLPKQDEFRQRKYLKSLRTRGLNLVRNKGNIYGLRFFIEYLIDQDKTEIEIIKQSEEPESPTVIYEGFDIDEIDIPFSLLILVPLLSISQYLGEALLI